MVLEVPAILGIRAMFLQRTGVTGLRFRSKLCNLPLRVKCPELKELAGRTFPHIELPMISEPGGLIVTRSLVRMPPHPFEARRHNYQKKGVPRGQQHFSVDAIHLDS